MNRLITSLLGGLLLVPGAAPGETLESVLAELRELPLVRTFDATVEARHAATVAAEVAGIVEEIVFDVDDYVEAGAVLIRFRDSEPRARVDAARAALAEARAGLARAEQEYARTRDIHARQLIAQAALDTALAQRDTARARVAAAQARLDEIEVQFGHTVVRAPYSGIVKARFVEVGELAQPGQPLMSGLSLDQLRVTSQIPQSVVPAVRDAARIRVLGEALEPIAVTRTTVFPYADPATHTVTLRADLPERAPGLYPGMYVKLAVEVGTEQALVIPAAALLQRSELSAVYVVLADGALSLRQVRPGRAYEGLRVVHAGLAAGERVALDPVRAGAELKAQAAGGGR